MELYALSNAVQTLEAGDTLLAVWQHWFIPAMINTLHPPTPTLLAKFPGACDALWREPEYAQEDDGTGDCYDAFWQLHLVRPEGRTSAPWQAVSFSQLHMGFGGLADSPCAEGLATLSGRQHGSPFV
jgi:hypothetical protein